MNTSIYPSIAKTYHFQCLLLKILYVLKIANSVILYNLVYSTINKLLFLTSSTMTITVAITTSSSSTNTIGTNITTKLTLGSTTGETVGLAAKQRQ